MNIDILLHFVFNNHLLCHAALQTTCLAMDQLIKSLMLVSGRLEPELSTSMFVGNTDLATCSAPLAMSQKVIHNTPIPVGYPL